MLTSIGRMLSRASDWPGPVWTGASASSIVICSMSSRAVDSPHFTRAVFVLIAANAVLLGAETYSGVVAAWLPLLKTAEHLFLAAFTAEILLRLAAHADRPAAFFRDPWNLFDLAVVTGAFVAAQASKKT